MTKRIKMLSNIAGGKFTAFTNDVLDLPTTIADQLVADGAAVESDAPHATPVNWTPAT